MADLGLNATQLANAETIIRIGKQRGMSERDIQTALAVALAESDLLNHSNSNVPESMGIPHDKVGSDHMSVGVFQQQVGIWGNAADLMNLEHATNLFYDALEDVPTRAGMSIPQAAQTVQKSAYGDGSNYAEELPLAQAIAGVLTGTSQENYETGSKTVVDPIKWIMDPGNLQRIGLFTLGGVIIIIAVVKILSGNQTVKLATNIATKGLVK
jgi:hypothetical protein